MRAALTCDHLVTYSRAMTKPPKEAPAVQVYRVYIKATPQAIWDAITKPEWSARYGYGGMVDYELKPGGSYRHRAPAEMTKMGLPEVMCDGQVVEADPPRKLVQTWRALFSPELIAE